jgi:hypothetical protein
MFEHLRRYDPIKCLVFERKCESIAFDRATGDVLRNLSSVTHGSYHVFCCSESFTVGIERYDGCSMLQGFKGVASLAATQVQEYISRS